MGFVHADASQLGVLDNVIKAEAERRQEQLQEAMKVARETRKAVRDQRKAKREAAKQAGVHDGKRKRREQAERERATALADQKREEEQELYEATLAKLLQKVDYHAKQRRNRFYKVQHDERHAIRMAEKQRIQEERLDRVDISNQQLTELPERLWAGSGADASSNLDHVVILNMAYNQLWELPPKFLYWLGSVRQFDASHNAIRLLPDEVGSMTETWDFNMSHNALSVIPPGIGGLRCLKRLDLCVVALL